MRRVARFGRAAVLLLALGCRQLPDLPEGACGNGVVEPPEDCDGFPQLGSVCRPPGTSAECRLDCSPAADGTRPDCPAGFGCDRNGVCRHESGRFFALPEVVPGNANALAAGDFDGDGRDDVVAQEAAGAVGFTKLRVHYFDSSAQPLSTWTSQKAFLARPQIADVSGDGRADLLVADGRVGSLLGERDRSLVPEAYPSYYVPHARARFMSVFDRDIDSSGAFAMLTQLSGAFGLYRGESSSGLLLRIADLPDGVDGLSAEPAVGDLFMDEPLHPCLEVALAYRAAAEVLVYSPCVRDEETESVRWRETAELTRIALPADTRIDGGLLIADVDGDRNLDLMVGAAERTYVAYGDGSSLGPLSPFSVLVEDASTQEILTRELPMPLVAGDFSADGVADFAYPQFLLISERTVERVVYAPAFQGFGAPWSEGLVADLNANGLPDLVLASEDGLDLDFFNGTGSRLLNPFLVPTTRPAGRLATGDFDGDLIQDLAFVEEGAANSSDELSVAFGNAAGAPDPPLGMGRLKGVQQVTSLPGSREQTTSQLIVTYTEEDEQGDVGSALAILGSGGDRSLLASIELNRFATEGLVQAVAAVALTAGAFQVAGRLDVAALSISQDDLSNRDLGLWLLRDIGSRRNAPLDLGWPFAELLEPVVGAPADPKLMLSMGSGDLDGDGLDEVVIAGRREGSERCVLSIVAIEGGDEPRVALRESRLLDQSWSKDSELEVGDVDGDGYPDVVLLTGTREGPRSLLVFWNDAGRGLEPEEIVSPESEPARAFALFRAGPEQRAKLAYVTEHDVRLLVATADHVLAGDRRIAELEGGTGIAAADVDGDGVTDLAVADSGGVRVLRAELEDR